MAGEYKFKVRMRGNSVNPIANIEVVKAARSLEFKEISVPVVYNRINSYREGMEGNYFMDFEEGVFPTMHSFKGKYSKGRKKKEVLSRLEEEAEDFVLKAINQGVDGRCERFSVSIGDGTKDNKRYGNVRHARVGTMGRKRKSVEGIKH